MLQHNLVSEQMGHPVLRLGRVDFCASNRSLFRRSLSTRAADDESAIKMISGIQYSMSSNYMGYFKWSFRQEEGVLGSQKCFSGGVKRRRFCVIWLLDI